MIYADDLRKEMADLISTIQKRDGVSLQAISRDIYGHPKRLMEVINCFDDIKHLQNELNRRVPEEYHDIEL